MPAITVLLQQKDTNQNQTKRRPIEQGLEGSQMQSICILRMHRPPGITTQGTSSELWVVRVFIGVSLYRHDRQAHWPHD